MCRYEDKWMTLTKTREKDKSVISWCGWMDGPTNHIKTRFEYKKKSLINSDFMCAIKLYNRKASFAIN